MSSDLMNNVVSVTSTFNCKNFSRKKRRYGKSKQCKMDACHEPWRSPCALKNKDCCKEGIKGGDSKKTQRGEKDRSLENLEMKRNIETNEGGEHESVHLESDSEFSLPNSLSSSNLFGGIDSGASFTNSSSSCTSSGGCCSGCITEEEGDDGCLDDWETAADALAVDDDDNQEKDPCLESNHGHKYDTNMNKRTTRSGNAWKIDDYDDDDFGQGKVSWASNDAVSVPSSCPICYEDLDFTDSSFLPCSCGFKLCLFCHKRILEEDGRCPGCRKPYEHDSMAGEITVRVGCLTLRVGSSSL